MSEVKLPRTLLNALRTTGLKTGSLDFLGTIEERLLWALESMLKQRSRWKDLMNDSDSQTRGELSAMIEVAEQGNALLISAAHHLQECQFALRKFIDWAERQTCEERIDGQME